MVKVNYRCNKCKFKFSRQDHVAFRVCPYCGSEGTVVMDEGNAASKLLDEVSQLGKV